MKDDAKSPFIQIELALVNATAQDLAARTVPLLPYPFKCAKDGISFHPRKYRPLSADPKRETPPNGLRFQIVATVEPQQTARNYIP